MTMAFFCCLQQESWYSPLLLTQRHGISGTCSLPWPELCCMPPGRERVFYILCAGQPLVIALSAVLVWAGLFAEWILAGIVLADGMLASRNDWLTYAAFVV